MDDRNLISQVQTTYFNNFNSAGRIILIKCLVLKTSYRLKFLKYSIRFLSAIALKIASVSILYSSSNEQLDLAPHEVPPLQGLLGSSNHLTSKIFAFPQIEQCHGKLLDH